MQELALMYLRRALEEAVKAGGSKLLDDLFSGMSEKQINALIGILEVVKKRKTSQVRQAT